MQVFPVFYHLPEFAQRSIESAMPSNHLILCCRLLLPSIFPSIRVFSNELVLHIRWPKYWSFTFSISPSNKYSELISLRIDWFNLFAVQWTLKSLLQHHSSKAPILQHSITFMVQLSYPYRNTGKIIALTTWAFVSKVMSGFFFNMLFRFVKVFLPRRKHLLISWWQSLCTVILEPKEIKSVTVSVVSQSIYHKVKGLDSMILVFECWVLSQLFHSLLSPSSRGSLFFFAFCHKGGVICIAEVIGVFPRNLDSSSCFTQASISHYVLCM